MEKDLKNIDNSEKFTLDELLADETFQNFVARSESRDVMFWEEWTEKHLDQKRVIEEASKIIREVLFNKGHIQDAVIEGEWAAINKQIERNKQNFRNRTLKLYQGWQKIAAVLIIPLILFSALFFFQLNNGEAEQFSEIVSQNGMKNKVILPDGSVVILNNNSTIRYSNHYNKKTRELFLTGEGYFKVAKDPKHPFIVHSNDHSVTALETEFSVREYANEGIIQVFLKEGIVKFKSEKITKDCILKPGNKLTYIPSSNEIKLENSLADIETAWVNNVLIIDDDSFDMLLKKLENWYGVDIELLGEELFQTSRYRIKLKTETMTEALNLLQYLVPMDYTIDGKNVKIEIKK